MIGELSILILLLPAIIAQNLTLGPTAYTAQGEHSRQTLCRDRYGICADIIETGLFPTSLFSSYYNNPTQTVSQVQPVITDSILVSIHPLTSILLPRTPFLLPPLTLQSSLPPPRCVVGCGIELMGCRILRIVKI